MTAGSGLVVQRRLAADQLEEFYHENFVSDQVRDFNALVGAVGEGRVVVDVGGGCGHLAQKLGEVSGIRTRVIDMDPASVEACTRAGVDARLGDALKPEIAGDEAVACFNLILHHLVGRTERETRALQIQALRNWRGRVDAVFVNEYIYESFVPELSGRLIFEITASSVLSFVARQVAKVVPPLRANTFGVGVRFRSRDEWVRLFDEAGYRVVAETTGEPEYISPPLRALMIKIIRRDSFRLEQKL